MYKPTTENKRRYDCGREKICAEGRCKHMGIGINCRRPTSPPPKNTSRGE